MRPHFVFVFWLLLSFWMLQDASAQTTGLKWYAYSETYQSYVPVSEPKDQLSFFLGLRNTNKVLQLEAPEGSSLFMDNRLLASEINDAMYQLSLDSLANVYDQDSAFFTVFHPSSLQGLKTNVIDVKKHFESTVQVKPRPGTASYDFFLMAIVLMLLTGGIIRKITSPQIAYSLGVKQLYQYQITEGPLYSYSFFSQESTAYYLFISFLLGLFGVYYVTNLDAVTFLTEQSSFISYVLQWLLYSVMIYLFFYVRFAVYKVLAGIFNFRRYLLIQNYDFMRVTLVISILYLLFMMIDLFLVRLADWWQIITGGILLVVYIFTTFRKLNKLYSHTKLHLFSYLCVSEIVPWIFLLGNLRN